MTLQTENLKSSHCREDFCSGKELLDNYIKKQANQDIKKKLSVCNVIIENEDEKEKVKGYYTLSNSGIPRKMIPENYQRKFPKSYTTIPVTLLGRLARDKNFNGKRAGEFLLMDALYQCYLAAKKIASFAVIVDPIDKEAESFYEKYGFEFIPDSKKMFLPMKTIDQLF
ncbi:GNAT family protein [Aquimarina mytili]|uniref:GNAT family N-acetyltransferase n=1 Tax=Aquimarina mytili TaxID=874423 RepID=A0A937DAD2_9FLAO|nr:GNAT family N-acetyltransferase [Aquimarina mytili]MBL0684627.1 GNAT family N-acetyltransferase [Aquimarina mytili]